MKGEVVRRLPQRESEVVCHNTTKPVQRSSSNDSYFHVKNSRSPGRDKRGARNSPSNLALLAFVLMCSCSAYFVAKILHVTSVISSSFGDGKIAKVMNYDSLDRLKELESEVQSILKQPVTSCQISHTTNVKSYEPSNLCLSQPRENNNQIVVHNPSDHDKFLCNGKIVLGPKKVHILESHNLDNCWKRPIQTLLLASSFPVPPTYENRGKFPGIVVEAATTSNKHVYDDTFSSGIVSKKTLVSRRDPSSPECDVKCDFETLTSPFQRRYVYGTNWKFIMSMEGEQYYPDLEIDSNAWNVNTFYATTSFRSEVPLPYFSFAEYNIQNLAVPFEDGIKGASFLARNCNSMNNREEIVQKLMNTAFRVDSLSSCLNNVDQKPGFDLSDKGKVLRKYLFHLAFENQNTDDYITEKLWGTLSSGTIPVYFGAPNAKDHVPFNGVIFVNDFPSIEALSEYLIKVSNDEKLYNSYHSWRENPLPQAFLDRYNISHTHSKCRTCRWAHAKKYGLGWNHTRQSLEPVLLPRETCVKANHLTSPAQESWFADSDSDEDNELKLIEFGQVESSCPLSTITYARVGNEGLTRSIWSNDGTTDFFIEGETSNSFTLKLAFPIEIHEPLKFAEPNVLWIQNDQSRVSLAFKASFEGGMEIKEFISVASGVYRIRVNPNMLPLRVRIIVENVDLMHKGAGEQPSYYGQLMAQDIIDHPRFFSISGDVELAKLSARGEKLKQPGNQFLHKKSKTFRERAGENN